jgi:hypothetical protein
MTTIDVTVPVPSHRPLSMAREAAAPSARAAMSADRRLGRAFLLGSLVGSVLVFAFCGGIALLAGMGAPAAAGIGLFTAFWGGPGFGGMMGATLYFSEHVEDF